MSGHKRVVIGPKGTKRLCPVSCGGEVKEAGFEPGPGFPQRPAPSRRETMTVHRGCGKSDTSWQNASVEVALSLGPSLGLLPTGTRRW